MTNCQCAKPVPVAPRPSTILCLTCGGRYSRSAHLEAAIKNVEATQNAESMRIAALASFLEDQGFYADEIGAFLYPEVETVK